MSVDTELRITPDVWFNPVYIGELPTGAATAHDLDLDKESVDVSTSMVWTKEAGFSLGDRYHQSVLDILEADCSDDPVYISLPMPTRMKFRQCIAILRNEQIRSTHISPEAEVIADMKGRVAEAFAEFQEVTQIYLQRYRRELQFKVLLNVAKYDWDLMDKLLAVELNLVRHRPKDFFLSISYLPKEEKVSIIHPTATLVFERKHG